MIRPLLLLVFLAVVDSTLHRNVRHAINPGCPPSICNVSDVTHAVNVVHFEAVGPQDSIHALWSTEGAPSALIARTGNHVNLSIDWDAFVKNQLTSPTDSPVIHFSSPPAVAFGFILRTLVEYDDKNDAADPDVYKTANSTTTDTKEYPLDRCLWSPVKRRNDTFVFQTSPLDKDFGESLRLEVRMTGNLSRGDALPRLQLTPNNTHLDLFLDNKTVSFDHSRFYLIVDVVNNEYPLTLTSVSTIDDEYTPGVFKTYRLGAADTKVVENARYAAWKPVAYTTSERSLEMQTLVKAFDGEGVDPGLNDVKSVVGEYFQRIGNDSMSRQIKIGFGQQEDKFYKNTAFSVWSVLVGIGAPPKDEISTLVVVVISVGLGVPAVFVILGGIYAGIRDRKEKKAAKNGVRTPLMEDPSEPLSYGAI